MLYLDWMSRFSGFIPQWIHFGVVCGILRLLMIFAIGVKNSNRRQMSRNRMVNNCTSSWWWWWWWWWWWAAEEEDEGGEDQDPSILLLRLFFHVSSDHQRGTKTNHQFPLQQIKQLHGASFGVWKTQESGEKTTSKMDLSSHQLYDLWPLVRRVASWLVTKALKKPSLFPQGNKALWMN